MVAEQIDASVAVALAAGRPVTSVDTTTKELETRETRLRICVRHLPPGTGQWNRIEHRLFSSITMNWRGRPLIGHEAIVRPTPDTETRDRLKG